MLYLFSSKPQTIEKYLREKGILYELVDKERYGVFLQDYIPNSGDLGIVYDFGKIIPDSLLQNLLMLNIHFSLLPKYRGAIPVESAILSGDTETGISIQKMVKGMDAGDLLLTRTVSIEPQWTSGELQAYMDSLLPALLDELFAMPQSEWKFTPQIGEPTFCYIRELTREKAILDFENTTAIELERKIRAYNPEPLAWTRVTRNGKTLEMNILKSETVDGFDLAPKAIAFVKQKGLVIGAKNSALLVNELVISGSKVLRDGDIVALKGTLELV